MNRRVIEWALNLIFWGVTSWFILSTFAIVSQEIEIINDRETVRTVWNGSLLAVLSALLFGCLLLFYFNLWNIRRLQHQVERRRVVVRSVAAFFLVLLVYFLSLQLPALAMVPRLHPGLVMGIVLFYFAVSFGYGISKVWLGSERERQRLELEKKQAELDLLRAQLHPHFLFNVLNNLLSMVDQARDPLLAHAIDRLSALLRHVVYDSGQERIPVEKEIDFIRSYAELQLLRFEAGEVDFDLERIGSEPHWVEPGIFLPFVENAFKHGTAPETPTVIRVHFDQHSARELQFRIVNDVPEGLPVRERGGAGLAATRARLQLAYPDRHQLTVRRGTTFEVVLKLSSE